MFFCFHGFSASSNGHIEPSPVEAAASPLTTGQVFISNQTLSFSIDDIKNGKVTVLKPRFEDKYCVMININGNNICYQLTEGNLDGKKLSAMYHYSNIVKALGVLAKNTIGSKDTSTAVFTVEVDHNTNKVIDYKFPQQQLVG